MVDEGDAMAAADGFTAAWLARDIGRLATFVTDDFVLWNNCSKADMPKPDATAFFSWLTTVMRGNQYYDIRQHLTSAGLVQQHLASFETDQGAFKDIPMMLVFTTRGQLVARCEAYLDSTGLPKLDWPQGAVFF